MDQDIILDKLKKAKQELIFNHEELQRCTKDLIIANVNLNIREKEKELNMEEFNSGLEQMMFAISHKVRKSVANILGLSKLLCEDVNLGNSVVEWEFSIALFWMNKTNKSFVFNCSPNYEINFLLKNN
ncbi:hypothetical protein Q1W71_07525 [Flavobacterium pectinovorum]|uniref:hypothetical protein n=1 Tax=Flavobacterium pectinovorum TaxID=29533 RepID=UPI00265FE9B9|nr:hypothetical protein [Flavobacterium pectinovorum]WKL49630.1 hypothetical protein Q1W71_07525 [Flavobacterium pectinovorum]